MLVLALLATLVLAAMLVPVTPKPGSSVAPKAAEEVTMVALPNVKVTPDAVAVAAAEMVREVALALAVTVAPTGMPGPDTGMPTTTGPRPALPNAATEEVTVVLAEVVAHVANT
jgi:hypothetical protein